MFTKITTGVFIITLSLITTQIESAPFRDVLEHGNTASMIGIGKIEGYTPHSAVLFENTAAITNVDSGLALFYLNGIDDSVSVINGAITHHLSPKMSVGFGIARESVGNLDFTGEEDGEAVSIDTFDYTNSAYIAGLGVKVMDNLNLGASYTHYEQHLRTTNGQGGAFGLSAQLNMKETDLFLKIKNIGNQSINYNEGESEPLLTEYGVTLGHHIQLLGTIDTTLMGQIKLSDNLPSLKSAGIRVYPFDKIMAVGVGYQESRGLQSQVSGGLTFGLDFFLSKMVLSYAYQATQYVAQDHEHHFSVFFGF